MSFKVEVAKRNKRFERDARPAGFAARSAHLKLHVILHGASVMRTILVATIAGFLSFPAYADDWASVAFTEGSGRLEIVTDYWIFSSGKSYEAQIPQLIKEGTRIQISYKSDERLVKADFDVSGISTKGELCRIHSKLPSRYSATVGDTIYVKPCRYK